MAGVVDEWVNRSGLAIDLMAHFDFGDAMELDYSLDSLHAVVSSVGGRFSLPSEVLDSTRQPEVEGVVAYVGECLVRVARGHWTWDDATGFAERGVPAVRAADLLAGLTAHRWRFEDAEATGVPVVHANTALGLRAVSPLHVLLTEVAGRPAREPSPIVAVVDQWRRAVDVHGAVHPEWHVITEPTLTDGMPIMPASPVLDAWLAQQRSDFPRWADAFGGTWDYAPESVDALSALVFRLTPTVAAFEDPVNAEFAEGAAWYFGEMLCRAHPSRWMYRAHRRQPGDPHAVCFTVQTDDNADFTTPFTRLANALHHGDPGRLRRGYDQWAEDV